MIDISKILDIMDDLVDQNYIRDYVIGGGFALLFHSTPVFTEDIDFFCYFTHSGLILDVSDIYLYLKEKYGIQTSGLHLKLDNTLIQILPASDNLTKEAMDNYETKSVAGKEIKVFSLEYLMAIMIFIGRPKDKSRLVKLIEEDEYNKEILDGILKKHGLNKKWNKFVSTFFEDIV